MPHSEDEAAVSRRVNNLAERLFELAKPDSPMPTAQDLVESLSALALAFISACENQGVPRRQAVEMIEELWQSPRVAEADHG